MNRPRRNLPAISYAQYGSSDSEDVDTFTFEPKDEALDSRDILSVNEGQVILPLTASQEIEAQNSIEEYTVRLGALDNECAELQKKLSRLDQKRLDITQRIFEKRARLSIMCRVPQDVLSTIFVHFVAQFKQSPWTLMHVDRNWRQTAFQTRPIWSGIEITSIFWYKKTYSRSRSGREVCVTEEHFRRALNRAGNTDLDIKISDCNPRGKDWNNGAINTFVKVLKLFDRLGRDGGLRITRLEAPGADFVLKKAFELKEITFPRLRELKFGGNNPDLVRHVASSAITLHCLELSHVSFKTIELSLAWWSRLSSLKISFDYSYDPDNSFPSFLTKLFSITTSLRHLELLDYCTFIKDPPKLTFPQQLTLITDASLGPAWISAPLLTHLTLVERYREVDEDEDEDEDDDEFIYLYETKEDLFRSLPPFPSLIHLDVQCRAFRLRYIQAPSLHTLDFTQYKYRDNPTGNLWFGYLEDPDRYDDGLNYFGSDSEMASIAREHREYTTNVLHPLILRINKMTIRQDNLFKILGSMNRLEELHIQGMMTKQSFFVRFSQSIDDSVTFTNPDFSNPIPPPGSPNSDSHNPSNFLGHSVKSVYPDSSDSHNRLPVPMLKKLSIDISGCREAKDKKYVKNLLVVARKCFKIRALAGSDIEIAQIKVTEDGEWIKLS